MEARHLPGQAQRALDLLQRGRLPEAEAICRAILAAHPRYFHALHLLGIVALQRGQATEAERWLTAALSADASHPQAHSNLAVALLALRRPAEAVTQCRRALSLAPGFAEGWSNQGRAFLQLKQPQDALAAFDRALTLAPGGFEAQHGRGCALHSLKRLPEAIDGFEAALRLRPDSPDTLALLANACLELGRYEAALHGAARATTLAPRHAAAWNAQANALWRLNRHAAAADAYQALLECAPDFPYALGNLAYCRAHACDWRGHEELQAAVLAGVAEGRPVCLPLPFLAISNDAAAQLQCARRYAADLPETPPLPRPAVRRSADRIRVAYVSGDFRDHAISYLLAGVFERQDRRRFEITAVALRPVGDSALGQRVRAAFDRVVDVSGETDAAAAQILHDLDIDIAVDLAGYTGGMRAGIFAYRPAPLQVNYLGFPATVASRHVDYLIADEFVVPPDRADCYSEHIAYLPECFQANDDRRNPGTPPAGGRPAAGLPDSGFVFCSFNTSYKITPTMFDIWMRLLHEVPGSVLWLLGDSAAARRNLTHEAERRGIAAQRLVFAESLPYEHHLGRLALADLFLDTLPFNAGTTASDALWAGLPVLTCAGDAFAARMAGSILHAARLPELATHSLGDYARRAQQLATDPQELGALRRRLQHERCSLPLFDTARFCTHLEAAYEHMWQRRQRGEGPATFRVPLTGSQARPTS